MSRCPQCRHENPGDAKFCLECGRRLALSCRACGTELPAGAKFCKECGQAVGAAPPPTASRVGAPPESYTPKHLAEKILTSKAALEGERKHVTVLFADLKGSMELLADRDPEEARKILDPILERMMAAVHHYEGTVNQVMGDGIMALFGAPVAHEDHAIRACYAALHIQESIKQYANGVFRSYGVPVEIRVGLNSGEVVVRSIGSDLHMDYTAVGQTTHLAARMEQIARPGTILLTPDTLSLAQGFVQATPRGPVPVKGLMGPIEIFELTGASHARSRLHAAADRGLTRFVGRETEIELLRQALGRAGQGHGQVVAIVGEPGVGKSRVVWEFTHSQRNQGWVVLEAASVSYGKTSAYFPVVALLRSYFHIEARDDDQKLREKVTGKLISLDRALEPTLPVFLSLLGAAIDDAEWVTLDPPQRRGRTLDALKRLLVRETQVQPILLVFEDLHWIDGETQAFLDRLVDSVPTLRMLLLVNYRPEYSHGWGSKTYYLQLRLDTLPTANAGELLEGLLGPDAGLADLQRLLIDRTQGNPFFLEETVRALVEAGTLTGERGAYRLSGPMQTVQLPATVQAILAARIDRLESEDKRLLQAASVLGKDVPLVLLEAITDIRQDQLRQRLARLQTDEFLYEARLFPEVEYTFKHALTHEVTYGSMLLERRRALHERTAQTIELAHNTSLEEHYDELAYHYSRSANVSKAVLYLWRAGHRALDRSALREAIAHLTSGLSLVGKLDPAESVQRELDLQITFALALHASRGQAAPEVAQAYDRARELAEQAGDIDRLFRVLMGLYRLYGGRMRLRESAAFAERLFALAQQTQDPNLLLEAQMARGTAMLLQGNLSSARYHLEQAIDRYSPERRQSLDGHSILDPGVVSLSRASWVFWLLGYPDKAQANSHETLALARRLGHNHSLGHALCYAGMLYQFLREPRTVQELATAAATLAQQHGLAHYATRAQFLLGWAQVERGEKVEGLAQMRKSAAAIEQTGTILDRPWHLAVLAEASKTVVSPAECLSMIDAAEAALDGSGFYYAPELLRLRGEFLIPQDPEEAERCLLRAVDAAGGQGSKSLQLRAVVSLGRLWSRAGRIAKAREALSEAYAWFAEGFTTPDLREAKGLLDELAAR